VEAAGVTAGLVVADEPVRAPGIGPHGAREARHRVAHPRASAVGDHGEVIVAAWRPVLVDDRDAPGASGAEAIDPDAALYARGARAKGAVECLEEHAPMEPDAEETRTQRLVVEVEEAPAAGRLTHEPSDPRAALEDALGEPEPLEHEEPRRLHHDPRADRAGLRDALEDGDVVARAREKERARRAGRAASHDGHAQAPVHGRTLHGQE
jgi:hypothetical protein